MSSPDHFRSWLPAAWFQGPNFGLTRLALNVICSMLFLVAVPMLAVICLPAARCLPRSGAGCSATHLLHWPCGISRREWAIFALLWFGGIGIAIAAGAWVPGVQNAYPAFRGAGRSVTTLMLSCALHALLILATEIFYRGVALSALHTHFRTLAVYLILPVYVLDHVGAPWAEVIASAAAGAILGHLALRLKSLWPGFLVHGSFALAVDLSSLAFRGKLLTLP